MAQQLSQNLEYIRVQTGLIEGLKTLSRDGFVKLVGLYDLGITANNWNTYEKRGSIPPIYALELLREKFSTTMDLLFFTDLSSYKVEKYDNDGYTITA